MSCSLQSNYHTFVSRALFLELYTPSYKVQQKYKIMKNQTKSNTICTYFKNNSYLNNSVIMIVCIYGYTFIVFVGFIHIYYCSPFHF